MQKAQIYLLNEFLIFSYLHFDMKSPYKMTMSLNVLNHLGIKLYSNVPSVISEVVANAWDADAELVEININDKDITIQDNGCGMSADEINSKYLYVGYNRRENPKEAITLKHKRPVMGRKGIGKLSLFSIAKIIEVQTMKNGNRNGLILSSEEIEKKIKETNEGDLTKSATYLPEPIAEENLTIDRDGTLIILKDLKKNISQTPNALKKRIARRFSVIGEKFKFKVKLNSEDIKTTDRDYFHKIQYFWYFDDNGKDFLKMCKKDKLKFKEKRDGKLDGGKYNIGGWIGTVTLPSDLKDEDENLNKILICVRGKLAQEDILEDFPEGGVYSKYLIGELYADFLDLDELEDMATSSRQEMIKDDPRYIALKKWLYLELKNIQNKWTGLRNEEGLDEALKIDPIKEWYSTLPSKTQSKAKIFFGKINQYPVENEKNKKFLFSQAVLAFEVLRYKENLDAIESLDIKDIEAFGKLFSDLDDIEATFYHQMIKGRLEIIDKLKDITADNELEKIVQKYLFDHLWLLDSSWDRATATPSMEESVSKAFKEISGKSSEDEKKGRIDIRYKNSANKHIIIELKRADRIVKTTELIEQINKYREALIEALQLANKPNEPIEVICVLGKKPNGWENPRVESEDKTILNAKGTRVVYYKALLENAYENYNKFIEKRTDAGKLLKLIKEIESN